MRPYATHVMSVGVGAFAITLGSHLNYSHFCSYTFPILVQMAYTKVLPLVMSSRVYPSPVPHPCYVVHFSSSCHFPPPFDVIKIDCGYVTSVLRSDWLRCIAVYLTTFVHGHRCPRTSSWLVTLKSVKN